jgi:hypothetical protein
MKRVVCVKTAQLKDLFHMRSCVSVRANSLVSCKRVTSMTRRT